MTKQPIIVYTGELKRSARKRRWHLARSFR